VLKNRFPNLAAALQALFVTFLWSTSWVLMKIGLQDIPALTFAGLRYGLAFVCLLPFAFGRLSSAGRLPSARLTYLKPLRELSGRGWARLVVLGLLFYAATQGAVFLGLAYLPSVTVSLLLNFTTIVIALMSIPLLAERPTILQWGGVLVNIAGVMIYFYPLSIPTSHIFGLIIVVIGVLANAASSLLGRRINREGDVPPLAVTVVSMGAGAAVLLAAGGLIQGFPHLNATHWAIIGWLAVVNTAFAFTLWNHTLRTLSAMESSIINSTMLVQIAVLAWLFLGERLTWREIIGMALAGIGALIVQLRRRQPQP
jgi:drug/metabolite transporter (DMT)-like permease